MIEGHVLNDKYKFLNRIGTGGSGEIWSAIRLDLEDEVAIKVLRQELSKSDRERLKKEAIITSKIKSSGVCKIYDYIESNNLSFIVMEKLEGRDLSQFLAYTKFTQSAIENDFYLTVARDIFDILSELHRISDNNNERGILHRDIKPANIFITESGEVKVLDLGIAKLLTDSTQANTTTISYTMAYCCPTLWKSGNYDIKSYTKDHDLYSLGLVLFELITGTRAFKGSGIELLQNIVSCNIDFAPLQKDGLRPIYKLLHKWLSIEKDTISINPHEIRTAIDECLENKSYGRAEREKVASYTLSQSDSAEQTVLEDNDSNKEKPSTASFKEGGTAMLASITQKTLEICKKLTPPSRKTPISLDNVVDKVVALGIPGLVLVIAVNTSGLYGAAALSSTLATLGGPLGMIGGVAFFGVATLISKSIAQYGIEKIMVKALNKLIEQGHSKESITKKIESYPISNELKEKLFKHL